VPALDLGGDAPPIGLRGHIEFRVDAGATAEIGGDRHAAGAPDRGNHRAPDRARGAGNQHDPVCEIGHLCRPALVR